MIETEFEEQLERLKDKLVVVEGKKDKLALERLGIKEIITLNKMALFMVIEEIVDMSEIAKGTHPGASVQKKPAISGHAQEHAQPFKAAVLDRNKEVAILTDLDKEGRKLYGKLNSGLQRFGVRVNNKFRDFLFRNTKVRQIEGLRRV
jgi:5S rRNA maturation endonuclease (ribonuclease M5)|tara:strand:+ start:116 stop:559 length:444 start_codon:yes stop_codon:yes gene_type:complete